MPNDNSSRSIEAISGLSAGFVTTLIAHPLDFIKLRLQLDKNSHSQFDSLKKIFRNLAEVSTVNKHFYLGHFIQNIYRGIGPNILGSTIAWSLYFSFYRQYKNLIINFNHHENDKNLNSAHYLLSAFLAGWSTSILTNPIWVIKTRMISTNKKAPGAYNSIFHGIKVIFKNEGLRGFYRGLTPALLNVSQGAVQFSIYDTFKNHILKIDKNEESLSIHQYLYSSAISKMIATCTFYPLQVIRSRLQVSHYTNIDLISGKITTINHNAINLSLKIFKTEGLKGFYKGLLTNLVKVIPATCITFVVYEKVKSFLTVN